MNKLIAAIALSLSFSLMLVAPAYAAVFKIATIAPEGSEWMNQHRAAADQIKARTEGRVAFKFYGGGVMGNDKKVLRKIRIGQLQGAAFSTSGLIERYPDILLYGLPFVFRSQAEVDYVRGRFDSRLKDGLRDAGFETFGFATGGFATFMSGQPIEAHDDLKGKKIWVPEGDNSAFVALQSMNLSPVVLPLSDVLTGLQTGLLDVIVTPPQAALLLQWYTKVDYINPLPVAYTLGILAVDTKVFGRLSAEDQAVVSEVMTETYDALEQINRRDNIAAREALLGNGLKEVEASADDIPYWYSVAEKTNAEMWERNAVDKGMLAEMMATLEEFRATGDASESIAQSAD